MGEVKVSNESDFLSAVRFKVYDQKKTLSESIEFDFEKDSEDIDVFPNEFILSPNRKQNVSLNITPIGSDNRERIFRVRAIPVPLDEMLSDNTELKKLLSEEQKLKYSQEGNTTAKLNVGIGYGAIVVTQPFIRGQYFYTNTVYRLCMGSCCCSQRTSWSSKHCRYNQLWRLFSCCNF